MTRVVVYFARADVPQSHGVFRGVCGLGRALLYLHLVTSRGESLVPLRASTSAPPGVQFCAVPLCGAEDAHMRMRMWYRVVPKVRVRLCVRRVPVCQKAATKVIS